MLPIAGFLCIEKLAKLANDKLFVIATDKGYCDPIQLEDTTQPTIVSHGSISLMVNFDAMAEYFKYHQGKAWLQSVREGIKTAVFLLDDEPGDLSNTEYAIHSTLESFSPGDFFNFHKH